MTKFLIFNDKRILEFPSNAIIWLIYLSLLGFSSLACLYAFFKPGIEPPIYPGPKLMEALRDAGRGQIIETKVRSLDKDSSDRKFSKLYRYKLADGNELSALVVRVRKQDDFKIESYGLLTKNVEPVYIKSPLFRDSVPYSMLGRIGDYSAIQTCIVPFSLKQNQADVRLAALTSTVKSLSKDSDNHLLSKIFGFNKRYDFSCLLLTYKLSKSIISDDDFKVWSAIVQQVQKALAN